jgi:hypothetical protein
MQHENAKTIVKPESQSHEIKRYRREPAAD